MSKNKDNSPKNQGAAPEENKPAQPTPEATEGVLQVEYEREPGSPLTANQAREIAAASEGTFQRLKQNAYDKIYAKCSEGFYEEQASFILTGSNENNRRLTAELEKDGYYFRDFICYW